MAVALLVLGVPIIDTFWIIVRRLLAGPLAVQPRPRATSTTGCSTSACRTGRPSSRSTGSASLLALLALLLSGVSQLYAFLGVFLAFGLVLFIPTRGALRRPEELEADAYDPDPDARDAGTDAPAE